MDPTAQHCMNENHESQVKIFGEWVMAAVDLTRPINFTFSYCQEIPLHLLQPFNRTNKHCKGWKVREELPSGASGPLSSSKQNQSKFCELQQATLWLTSHCEELMILFCKTSPQFSLGCPFQYKSWIKIQGLQHLKVELTVSDSQPAWLEDHMICGC